MQLKNSPNAHELTSVRQFVAAFTSDIHTRLHHHPAIGRLLSDDISTQEYHTLLAAYQMIYNAAEKRRYTLDVWPELALKSSCDSLEVDLSRSQDNLDGTLFSWVTTPLSTLGILYVLHGANFGGKVIAKKLETSLPHVSKTFFTQTGVSHVWRTLVRQLETTEPDLKQQQEIAAAAHQTFRHFDSIEFSNNQLSKLETQVE